MNNFFSLLAFLLFPFFAFSQQEIPAPYANAYAELENMLEGRIPLDFKRAVFISENAFHNDSLSYEKFSAEIAAITQKLKNFIRARGLAQYKTSGHYAIFSYMTEASALNNFKTCTYDFDDFMGESDWTKMFVTKLMKTKKGNCHSLPYLFKILAEEMQAEAYLAIGPNHVYIKHIDEHGKWVNIELTNGHAASDAWIISSLGISAEAIKSGIYMDALDLKQSVAMCLFDLAMNYKWQHGYDEFMLKCCNTVLKHYPKCIQAITLKSNVLASIGKEIRNKNGGIISAEEEKILAEYNMLSKAIEELGYREMPQEQYDAWLKSVEADKTKQSAENTK